MVNLHPHTQLCQLNYWRIYYTEVKYKGLDGEYRWLQYASLAAEMFRPQPVE